MIRRKNPVTPEVRARVLQRDEVCFLWRLTPEHSCRDAWGEPHHYSDTGRLTLDHVKRHARMGLRAPSRPEFMVAMCASANVGVPSKAVREAERGYLRDLYPDAWR